MSQDANKNSPWGTRCVAILLLAIEIYVYGLAFSHGITPPGHPWSGIFFVTFAAWLVVSSFRVSSNPRWLATILATLYFVLIGIAGIASVLWNTPQLYTTGGVMLVSTFVVVGLGAIELIAWAWRKRRRNAV